MQACIITAYHKFDQLQSLISLLEKRFEVYVHIDKKADLQWKQILKETEHVHIFSKFKVNWGGSEHLKAIVYLMNEATKNPIITYFHIISGDDWPVRGLDEIYDHFEDNDEIDLLTTKLSNMTPEWYRTSVKWQKYYSFLDIFNYKDMKQKIFVKMLVKFQQMIGIDRLKNLDIELAQGLVWGDIPRDAFLYCMEYIHENPEFWEFMTYGHASEEFFFQTILANSEEFSGRITNKNYRYMNWNHKNGSYPAILDLDDLVKIKDETYYFARKIDSQISKELLDQLDAQYRIN